MEVREILRYPVTHGFDNTQIWSSKNRITGPVHFDRTWLNRRGKVVSNPDKKFKAAMIGVGDITDLHYPAYDGFEHAELAAVCDLDRELVERRRREWGVAKATTDYREILENPGIDIVEVNTPHHTHRKIVIDALAAGKHVACQKPIATTIEDAEAMIFAARHSTGRLRVLENFVFYPAYVRAKELIENGEIGEVLAIRFKVGTGLFGSRWVPLRSELWHLVENDHGRGQAVFDDGYHKLSLAIFFAGAIEGVTAFIDRSFSFIDEPAQLIWRYAGKKTLGSFDLAFSPNLYTSSKYFPVDERVDITGTQGMIHLPCCTARLYDEAPLVLYKNGRRYHFDDLETDWQTSFTAGVRDFPLALKEGRDTLISAERALDIVRFAFALIISAKTGTEIRPAEVTDELFRNVVLKGKDTAG